MCGNGRGDNSKGNQGFLKTLRFVSPSYYIQVLKAWYAGERFIARTYHTTQGNRLYFFEKGDPLVQATNSQQVGWLTNL